MIIYVAGPMRGYNEENKPAFEAAKNMLQDKYSDLGYDPLRVIIPHDIFPKQQNGDLPMSMYIRADVEVVLNSTIIFMLKGWEKSTGASAEHAIAKWAGCQIQYE